MEIITSTSNQFVKLARSLSKKKFRDESGLFVVEGANILRDMPHSESVEFFLVDSEKAESFLSITETFSAPTYFVQSRIFSAVSDTVSPQGIIAVVKQNKNDFVLPNGNALVLDKVADAGNLGTILRTAAATGFTSVYFLECADFYCPKAVRASMGGVFKTKCYNVNEEEAVKVVEATSSFALDMNGESMLSRKIATPLTLIGGSETSGVRDRLIKSAKQVVSLPMKNNIESLNVAVALAVAMYSTI